MIKGNGSTQADGKKMYDDIEALKRNILWSALQGALSLLGESSMKAVMHHLSKRGVDINSIDIKDLEYLLHSLFGDGASVIINEMYKRLEKEYLRHGLDIDKDVNATIRERMMRLNSKAGV